MSVIGVTNSNEYCEKCVHNSVCMYKKTYQKACEAVSELMVSLDGENRMMRIRDMKWINNVYLRCNNFCHVAVGGMTTR